MPSSIQTPVQADNLSQGIQDAPVSKAVREPLPDGSDISQYGEYKKWAGRRWAWEFLCRNENFVEDCGADEKDLTDEQKDAIKSKYQLIRFKHPSEPYFPNAARFLTGQISSWSNIDEEMYLKLKLPTKLNHGEVLIRFNLNASLSNRRSLASQLNSARVRLEAHLRTFVIANKAHPKTPKQKKGHLIDALRMVDAKRAGMKNADIAKMVIPLIVKNKSREEAAIYFKSRYRSARDLVEKGFLELAASTYKPLPWVVAERKAGIRP